MSWIYLAIAIAAEIIATTALKASDGFSRFYPSAITVVGYSVAFYCLALTLRVIPVGIAYAIWSGVGIVAISLIGYVLYKQTLDAAALLGIGLIVAGVVVLNVFSKSAMH
jgi:small multidrug resistance pump